MIIHSFLIELLGLLATITSVATLIPQIIYTLKSRKVKHISVYMCIIGIVSSILWCIYAVIINCVPLFASQCLALITKGWLYYLKIIYTKRKPGETIWHLLFSLPVRNKELTK